jgi:uncharacterized membrane protein YfcA
MMAATAIAMLRGRRVPAGGQGPRELPVARILLDGVVVGLVTGLVGAGGGFLVVPALALLGGLPMATAVGTSLLVIAMKSGAGLIGYLHSVQINWALTLAVTAAAVAGSFLGSRLAGRVPEDALRKAFGWFVIVMAGFLPIQQSPGVRDWLLTSPLLGHHDRHHPRRGVWSSRDAAGPGLAATSPRGRARVDEPVESSRR